MMEFNPERLTVARQRRGMNKAELAEASGITTRSISAYEAGSTEPNQDNVKALASALKFPQAFFYIARTEAPSVDAVSFRSMTSLTASQRDSALGSGAIAIDLTRWIDERFTLPCPDIPDLRNLDPENAACTVREIWKLGNKPIRNMIHLLELHGVRVFSLSERSRELDAYSLWHGAIPFCFLNTEKSVEHSRFDAAHELGHLAMHKNGSKHADAEKEANAFAAEFLMPRSTVLEHVARRASLRDVIKLKRIWGVSAAALAHRIHKLQLISEWEYRMMCMEMGSNGYRTHEPDPIAQRETSQIFKKVFSSLRSDGTNKASIARDLSIYAKDLDAIVFGLVMTGIQGSGGGGSSTSPRPPNLRLIESKN